MKRTLAFALVILAVLALAAPLPAAPLPSNPLPSAIKLSVTSVSSTQVALAWAGRFPAAGGFSIERSTDQTVFIQIAAAPASATNYLDTGLIPDTTYFYRVRSFSTAGSSRYSNQVQAQTPGPAAPVSLVQWGNDLAAPPAGLTQLVAVAVGEDHQLALKADGTVVAWGDNTYLQAVPPANLSNVVAIAAGGYHSLALKRDGTVVGWGLNDSLQATPPTNLNHIIGIAGGGEHSLALQNNGTVIGWGDNSYGQAQPPTKLNHVAAIAAGDTHSLALKADGTVVGWGDDFFGEAQPPPQLADVVAVAAGSELSLALKNDGTVVGWGQTPAPPSGLNGVVAIAAGGSYSLALKSDGTVVSWGYNEFGDEGTMPALVGVTDIAVGGYTFLALSILPGAPLSLAARIAATNEVDLSWQDNSVNADSFIIERAPALWFGYFPGPTFFGAWTQIATVGAGFTQYEDTSVATNATYGYRVSAHNQFGTSLPSLPVTVVTLPPDAPVWQLSALGSTNQVDLAWFDDGPVDGFQIERAPDAGGVPGAWSVINPLLATNASYVTCTDTNVTALTTNWYRVLAFNVLGSSPYSEAVSVAVVPPPPPDYFSANAFRNQINLSWYFDAGYGAVDGFEIDRAPDAGGSPGAWSPIANIGGDVNEYTDSNLVANTTYWYQMRAFNWVGNGGYSPPASATIVPPAAPADFYAQIGVTNHQVILSWNEYSSDEDGFTIERAPDSGGSPGTWKEIGAVLATNADFATYTDTKATALTTNWYRIQAYNELGTSAYSQAIYVQVVPPPAAYDISASVFRNQISLSWLFDYTYGFVNGFTIQRAKDMGGSPGTWVTIGSVANGYYYNTYTDTNQASGGTFWYRVQAFNWVGGGDYSPMVNATILPPAVPTALAGQVGAANHQVNLSWYEASADQNGFQIERAPDAGGTPGTWTKIGTVLAMNTSSASYTDPTAKAFSTNWYRVLAYNDLGSSAYSEPASVQVVPPPAPDSLTANAFRNQINLSWYLDYNNGTVNGFKIERAPDVSGSPGAWAQIAVIAGSDDYGGYTDTNLTGGATYWYRVRAFNWVGNSDYSPTASATIVPPATPTGLYGLIGTTNQVNLSWDESSADEDGFSVERAPDNGGTPGTWTTIGAVSVTNSGYATYTDTNVTALTTNWYRVSAFNSLGTSSYSQAASVQVVPPPAPDYLYANVFRDQITLSWSADYDDYGEVDGVGIERAPDVGGSPGVWTPIASVAGGYDYDSYTDPGLAVNTTYWYRVQAFNWVGDGDYSPTASATIVPPAAPTGLYGQIGATNQVNLSWSDIQADEDGFSIERAPDVGGSPGAWTEIGTLLATNYSYVNYVDTNVTALTTNWYRVQAFNSLGVSAYSQAASVQVIPPPAPDYLAATVFRDQITLSWYADFESYGAVDGFYIERAPDAGGSPGAWVQIATIAGGGYYYGDSYTDSGLAVNTTYWYRVQAFNWVGDGDYSQTANATILPPATPTYLYGEIGGTNQVNLSWSDSQADADGFVVERAPDAGGIPGVWTEIGALLATNASYAMYTDTNVSALTTNWYRVQAFNNLGTSSYSEPASVQVVPPPAPYYLSANAFRNQITLSWAGNNDSYGAVNGYTVERAPDVNGSPGAWVPIANTGSDVNEYTDSNGVVNKTYWYQVRAFNWVGNGDNSPPASATIVPPAIPSNLYGQIGTTIRQINLSWYEYSADQNGFQIERAPDVGGSPGIWTKIGTLLATNAIYASYTDMNVTALTTNWYRVSAFNNLGTSSYSQPASVQVVPPPAPYYLSASVFRNQITLSWYDDYYNYGPVDGFKIERAPDVGGNPGAWAQIASIAAGYYDGDSYTDTNRTVGATYWYRVRAFNWVGNGAYSPTASGVIVPPATPTDLYGQIGATNQVNLSWDESSADADGFSVESAPDAGGAPGTWMVIGTVFATNNNYVTYSDTNVTALATNWYRVRAFSSLGTSAYSEAASVQILPPPAPDNLSASAYRYQITLSWYGDYYDYGAVDGFKIERAPDASGSPGAWAQIAIIAGGDDYSGYTDTNRTAGATYWYRVRAFNWVGDGDYSPTASATIVPPGAPGSLSGQIGATNQVNLSWYDFSSDEDGFTVESAPDNGGTPGTWTVIGTVLATNYNYASFTDTNVTALTTNWYRVSAFNSIGTSAYSQAASVQVVPPPAPIDLFAYIYDGEISLSWYYYFNNYGDVDGFEVDRAPDVSGTPGTWVQIANDYYDDYTDTNVTAGATYWYQVRAYNWVGEGDYSQPVSASIPLVTSDAASLVVPNLVPTRVRITSLVATNCDVLVVWQTIGGTTNVVEATSSLADGFTNLSPALPIGGSGLIETNYLDAGALTNAAQRFYRVKSQ